MITHLTGIVHEKDIDSIVLDVSGIGYRVFVASDTLSALPSEGKTVSLWTHLAVRETSLDLYGFIDKESMRFFELLLSISGIGPKSALGVLSVANTATLRSAIISGDTSYLTKVSGIGSKTAQKIVLELKDKIGSTSENELSGNAEDVEVIEALRALGYSTIEAREALQKISPAVMGTAERVRSALMQLGQ